MAFCYVIDIQPLSSPMSGSPYKQLHEIKCGPVNTSDRLNLVDVSNNGYIATVADKVEFINAQLVYLSLSLAGNSDCTTHLFADHGRILPQNSGTPIHRRNIKLKLATATSFCCHSACNLSDVSRPIRVCGGEGLTTDGHPGWEIRDFAWNPTIPALFVTILRSGAVRLLSATPNATEPDELVDQLPSTADARCLSWSTKGKQLAICITGTVTTQTGPMCGPLILQTDPKLRLKRIVPLNTLKDQIGAGSVFCPLDILWTSPSCFIIGLQSSSKTTNNTMNALMVNAPSSRVRFRVRFIQSAYPFLCLNRRNLPRSRFPKSPIYVFIQNRYIVSTTGEPLDPDISSPLRRKVESNCMCSKSHPVPRALSFLWHKLNCHHLVLCWGWQWVSIGLILRTTVVTEQQNPRVLQAVSSVRPVAAQASVLSTPRDVPLPKSLQIAAAQFSAALQAEAESGRAAWCDLFEMMLKGHQTAIVNTEKPTRLEPSGVDVTESKLHDTELFLKALDDVLCELNSSSLDRKEEVSNCAAYADKVRKALRVCAAGDWIPVLAGHLDPESARLLGRLKLEIAAFESVLFDLDSQLESCQTENRYIVSTTGEPLDPDISSPLRRKVESNCMCSKSHPVPTSPLISVAQIELPPSGFVLGLAMGFYWPYSPSGDRSKVVAYLITRLTNGNLAPYALRMREVISPIIAALPEPVELPVPPVPSDAPVSLSSAEPQSQSPFQTANTTGPVSTSQNPNLIFNNRLEATPNSTFAGLSRGMMHQTRQFHHNQFRTMTPCHPIHRSTPTSKLLSVLDTTTRLLQTERGRVDYIRERFERLQAVSGTPMKELSWSVENSFSTPRTSRPHASRTKSMAEATGDHWINPAWYSLAQRDRALYRLFAKHQLPTVHAQFVAPLISDTSESTAACVAAVISSTDSEALASNQTEQMESLRPAMGEISLNNPQQMKLDKLVDMSGKAANANSPPSTKSLLIQDPSRTSTSFGQSARATPSSPFIVKAAPVRITTSSTVHAISETTKPALVSSTAVTATTTGANVTDSPSPMQKTEPSAGATSCSMTDAHASFSPTGSFRLGLKAAACMSPVPTNVVVQKSSVVSPDALSSPVRTCTPTSVSSGTTTVSQSVNPQSHLYSQETRSPGLVPASPPGQSVSAGYVSKYVLLRPCISDSAHPTSTFTSPATTLSLSPSADGASIFAQPKTSPVVTVLGTVISKTEALSTTAVTPSGVTTPLSTASPFAFLSTSSVAAANLFGSTGTSLFGPAVTTAVASSAALPPGQTKPADMGSQSVTSATGVTTASSIFSLPLFGTASKIQAEVTAATSTGPTVSTGGLFQLGSSTLPATSTVATTATAMASMRSLFGAQPSTPAFGTPAFGSTVVTTAAATTISSTMTNSVSLFGAPSMANSSSGGLFGSLKTNTSTVASAVPSGFLFGSLTTAASGGGLFGTVMVKTTTPVSQPTTVTGLFGSSQTTTAGSVGSGSLFGAMDAATTSAASATGPPANAIVSTTAASTGLFGGSFSATGAPSAGLFGAVATTSAPATAGLFGLSTATSNAPSIGLFGAKSIPATTTTQPSATSPNTQQAGGLFGALGHAPQQNTGSNTGIKEIGNLFSGSSFGLGSAAISPQTPPQNVFGRPSAVPSASPGLFGAPSKPAGAGLFGAPAFGANITSPNTGTGLFGSSSPASAGLFGSVGTGERGGLFGTSTATTTASTGLFGSSATAVSSPSNTGGLFGSSGATAPPAGGGLFGSSASGGFGSRPVFDSSGFGSAAAQLAAKSGGPSFGSLAMGSPSAPAAPASPFGSQLILLTGKASTSVTPSQKSNNKPTKVVRPETKPAAPTTCSPGATNPTPSAAVESKPPRNVKTGNSVSAGKLRSNPTSRPVTASKTKLDAKVKLATNAGATANPKPETNKHSTVKGASTVAKPKSVTSTTTGGQKTKPSQTKTMATPTKPKPAAPKAKRNSYPVDALDRQADLDAASVSPGSPPSSFYSKARDYWIQVPATVDGMLGGYSSLNIPDVHDSHAFLDAYGPKTTAYALDCGAGIGRVTKHVLLPRFNLVDMVELNQTFLDRAEEYIGPADFASVGERFCSGLQDFIPPHGRYDLVWIQWVLGHLTDIALIGFLKRCTQALSCDGRIVIKENVVAGDSEDATFDDVDSSFTRSRKAFLDAFRDAGLELIGEELQTNFPTSIYPVRMFALKRIDAAAKSKSDQDE
ncbi:Methyltransferase protein 11A [Fasciola gigantica]|uniref:Alpha N-terminal protein methyltransferase 1 n=1 Tax=Fasciola gigantica TaxID=46835 RepID=A0A504Z0H4_FASGI|nr:Methyltransferase protein 11A [Fasciola gigantica]